jgi:hypothetical protein
LFDKSIIDAGLANVGVYEGLNAETTLLRDKDVIDSKYNKITVKSLDQRARRKATVELIEAYLPKLSQAAIIGDTTQLLNYWEKYGPLFMTCFDTDSGANQRAARCFLGANYTTILILRAWSTRSFGETVIPTPKETISQIITAVDNCRNATPDLPKQVYLALWDNEGIFKPQWYASSVIGIHKNLPTKEILPLIFNYSDDEIHSLIDKAKDEAFRIKWLQDKYLNCIAHALARTPARILPTVAKGELLLSFALDGNLYYFITNEISMLSQLCQGPGCSNQAKSGSKYCSSLCRDRASKDKDYRNTIRESVRGRMRYSESNGGPLMYEQDNRKSFSKVVEMINVMYDQGLTRDEVTRIVDKELKRLGGK